MITCGAAGEADDAEVLWLWQLSKETSARQKRRPATNLPRLYANLRLASEGYSSRWPGWQKESISIGFKLGGNVKCSFCGVRAA